MCSTEQVFAWAGAILVNGAFISIITYGAFNSWYVGFIICAIYTILLFLSARTVDKRSKWDAISPVEGDAEEANQETDAIVAAADSEIQHDEVGVEEETDAEQGAVAVTAASDSNSVREPKNAERRMPVMANFFYGLFTLALGVTGYFLPVNLVPCNVSYSETSNGSWSTDMSVLSDEVQNWASSSPDWSGSTFGYLNGGNKSFTLFQGSDGNDYTSTLWSLTGASKPVNFPEIRSPSYFVLTTDNLACFTAYYDYSSRLLTSVPKVEKPVIGCSNGTHVITTVDSSKHEHQNPHHLYVDVNKTLWFKDYPPDGIWTSDVIYSISNYETMEVDLHSIYTTSDGSEIPKIDDECLRKQNIIAIFVSAVPTVIASVIIWLKRNAPAMAITSNLGISGVAVFMYIAITGMNSNFYGYFGWLFTVMGFTYLVLLSDLTHCNRKIARIPLIWGINFGSLEFFVGMILLTRLFGLEEEPAWSWIVFNIFGIIPIGIIGVGYRQVFLLVLCAVGWLMTAVKIASAIAAALSSATFIVYFVVLALSGILIAGFGWMLNRHQEKIHDVLSSRLDKLSLSRKAFPQVDSQSD